MHLPTLPPNFSFLRTSMDIYPEILIPYNFEPINESERNENENESLDSELPSFMNINNDRLGNFNWCECQNCDPMPTGL